MSDLRNNNNHQLEANTHTIQTNPDLPKCQTLSVINFSFLKLENCKPYLIKKSIEIFSIDTYFVDIKMHFIFNAKKKPFKSISFPHFSGFF